MVVIFAFHPLILMITVNFAIMSFNYLKFRIITPVIGIDVVTPGDVKLQSSNNRLCSTWECTSIRYPEGALNKPTLITNIKLVFMLIPLI